MLDETPASADPEKHSNRRVEALIASAERYVAQHADDIAPGVGSYEVGLIRSLIDALMRTDRPAPAADDRRAEMAVLRVLTNGEPVTHEVLDALRAVGWGPLPTPPADEHPAHSGHRFGGGYARASALLAGDPDWTNATGGQPADDVREARLEALREAVFPWSSEESTEACNLIRELLDEVRPRGTVTDAEVTQEAHRRYDGDTIIDENTGEPTSHDDWGYAECQRQAFIAGVSWAQRDRS